MNEPFSIQKMISIDNHVIMVYSEKIIHSYHAITKRIYSDYQINNYYRRIIAEKNESKYLITFVPAQQL